MARRRICNIVCDITSGGVESVLLNYFSHMDRSKYELALITYDVKSDVCADKFKQLGFNIIVIPPKREGFRKSVRAMQKAIAEGHFDVVHSHLTEWNCIPMFLAWKCGIKTRISHSHMADSPHGIRQKTLFTIQKALNKIFATQYCACGEEAAIYLYGKNCLAHRKVKILNNAIDVERFAFDPQVRCEVRRKFGIEPDTFCVGHIGRFLEQKNHDFLVDIFVEVLNLNANSCLLLLGTGELEPAIREKIKQLNIEDKVRFLGVRGDAEHIYQAMDVFCLPSLFEGLPVVGIEAQAAGLPCLISDKVTTKVKITELVKFFGLDKSASEWADALYNLKRPKKKIDFPDTFNIEKAAYEWEKLYV